MNQKTTYEVTITRKLDQLPIPDLREAIWARIEGDLDADMPTDDGGDTPPSAPSGGGKVLHFALPGLVVLLVTLFLIKTNQKDSQPLNIPPTTPAIPTITTTPTASPPPLDIKTITPNEKTPVVYPGNSIPVSDAPTQSDSVAAPITDVVPSVTDNTNQQAPLVQAPPPQPIKTDTIAQKKKRGVSGITDNDYRITPVKPDSSRKNDQ